MRYDEWRPIARRISAAWPAFGSDPETERVYYQVLQDVDARAVERAVDDALREGRESPPPPGVIRDRALGIRTGEPPRQEPPRRRSGTGWIVVAVVIALGLAVAAVAITVARDDSGDSEPQTTTEIQTETSTPTITVTPPPQTVTAPTETESTPTTTEEPAATAP